MINLICVRNFGKISGDPAYRVSFNLQAPYLQAQNNECMKHNKVAMNDVRISVEWLFGIAKNYFKFFDFKNTCIFASVQLEKSTVFVIYLRMHLLAFTEMK